MAQRRGAETVIGGSLTIISLEGCSVDPNSDKGSFCPLLFFDSNKF